MYIYCVVSKITLNILGVTQDLRNRLEEHNNFETKSNKSKAPFKIEWCCCFSNKTKAYLFEKYLKSSSGYAFTNKHLI
jgi:predicted GIY-YIG superfamily endonuclease